MATARQHEPPVETPLPGKRNSKLLPVVAAVIGTLCAGIAFFFFLVRDRGHARIMVNDQAAPGAIVKSSKSPAKIHPMSTPASVLQASDDRPTEKAAATVQSDQHAFTLTQSSRTSTLGPLRLRLLHVDPAQSWFDMGVVVGHRLHTHPHLKANEPLWITVNRNSAIQLVATTIQANGIVGYWTESNMAPQVSARSHNRK